MKIKNVFPFADRIMVEKVTHEDKTPGGIVVVENSESAEGIRVGKVLAVGAGKLMSQPVDGKWNRPMKIKPGDYIAWSTYAGQTLELELGQKELFFVNDEDIIATLEVEE